MWYSQAANAVTGSSPQYSRVAPWLEAASATKDEELFHRITKLLVLSSAASGFKSIGLQDIKLPDFLPSELESQRKGFLFEILASLNAAATQTSGCFEEKCRTSIDTSVLQYYRGASLTADCTIASPLAFTCKALQEMAELGRAECPFSDHVRHCSISDRPLPKDLPRLLDLVDKIQSQAGFSLEKLS